MHRESLSSTASGEDGVSLRIRLCDVLQERLAQLQDNGGIPVSDLGWVALSQRVAFSALAAN
ncbi:MAG: hypothetical protein GC160_16150 [Acidobacteria bacterium]|nr:hypothetical protein [Acidobacteriota bacterium]